MSRLGPTLLLVLTGCATADTSLRFEGLEHPVSLSPHLPRVAGSPELVPIGPFRREVRAFGVLYGLVPLQESFALAPVLDEEIRRLGGAGAVNVEIEVHHCVLNYIIPLSLLPFWPTCARVELRGDVVGPPG